VAPESPAPEREDPSRVAESHEKRPRLQLVSERIPMKKIAILNMAIVYETEGKWQILWSYIGWSESSFSRAVRVGGSLAFASKEA